MRRRRISMLLSLAAVFVLLLIGVPTPAAATGPSGPSGGSTGDPVGDTVGSVGDSVGDAVGSTGGGGSGSTGGGGGSTGSGSTGGGGGDSGSGSTGGGGGSTGSGGGGTTGSGGGGGGGGGGGTTGSGGGGGGGGGGVIIVDPPPVVGDPTPIPTDEVGPWDRTGQGQDKGFFGDPSTGGQTSGGTQVGGTTTASTGAAIGQFVPSWLLSLPGFEGAALSTESASVLAAAATILAGGEGEALDGTSVGGVTFPSELAWDIATAPARYGLTPTSATGPFGNIKYLGIPALILGALALLLIVASSRNIEDLAGTARHPHARVS